MNKFIDRVPELETLQKEYDKDRSSLVILYGRRRVGKTPLIAEFIKNKPFLFFLATEESEQQNRIAFQKKAAELTGNVLLAESTSLSWDALFRTIGTTAFLQKPVIVIDEFQYLGKSNPVFLSILQRIWDEYLGKASVMLILCGSLISMMESQTLAYSSPLYGRRTAQIRLTQIPFRYYHEFYPEKSIKELIEFYSVTGGVPKYIELFSEAEELYECIQKTVLNRASFLYEEPYFLLQQEVEDIGTYFSVIRAIAAGNSKMSAIASILGAKATSLSKYLHTLIDLDILEREVPVTEENPEKSKKGLYRIKDNYLKFWFMFIYPNRSFIETGNSEFLLDIIKCGLAERHTAFVFEDICREQMWLLNVNGRLPFLLQKVGRWWSKDEEIDVVGLGVQKQIIFGECKYRSSAVGTDVFYKLKEKAGKVIWNLEDREEWFILFSLNGFTKEMEKLAEEQKRIILIGVSFFHRGRKV